jgi:hypothetical protein
VVSVTDPYGCILGSLDRPLRWIMEVLGECRLDSSDLGLIGACGHGTEQITAKWLVTLYSPVDGYVPLFLKNIHESSTSEYNSLL